MNDILKKNYMNTFKWLFKIVAMLLIMAHSLDLVTFEIIANNKNNIFCCILK